MANHLVDGVRIPVAVAGHPALELCNTRAGWGTAAGRDYLVDLDVVAVWAREVGLLDSPEAQALVAAATADPGAGAEVLADLVALRGALYEVLCADLDEVPPRMGAVPGGRAPRGPVVTRARVDITGVGRGGVAAAGSSALDVVAAAARAGVAASGLAPRPDGTYAFDGGTGLRLPVHRCALAAVELLARWPVHAVGRCPGGGCGWLFLDPSGRRRWCVMAICGNRHKARRYAERRRTGAPDLRGTAVDVSY